MAQMRLDAIRLGLTSITGGGGIQTLGSVACSTLVGAMANGTQMMVDVLVVLFANAATPVYASMTRLTAGIALTAGPTYTLGTVTNAAVYGVGSGPTFSALTLDISGGNLRVRVTPGNETLDGYAVVSTYAP